MTRHLSLIAAVALSTACLTPVAAMAAAAGNTIDAADISAAVNAPSRPFYDTARDADRKPAQVLAFSGIRKYDIMAELVPGGGYYTRMLSAAVGPIGRVYTVVPMKGGAPVIAREAERKAAAEGKARPNPVDVALELTNVARYRNVEVLWESMASYGGQFSVPVQLDMVWTTDNYHDMHNPGFSSLPGPNGERAPALDMVAVNKQIYASLKPGGIYFIVDHAAAKGAGFSQTATLHRADPDAVKKEVMAAGFVLDGESNILANPADDHTKPVFQMHDKTDQFIFRFKKPATASSETKRPAAGAMDGYFGHTQESGIAPGDKTHRWVNYYPDGSYDEYGISGTLVQQGTWYWDAAGHNCMIHQFPASERQGIVCHQTVPFKKVGDVWTLKPGDTRQYKMDPDYEQPKVSDVVGGGLGHD